MKRYIPNILTLMRIPLTIFFLILFCSFTDDRVMNLVCISLITLVLLSDFIDGKIARKIKAESKMGSILDPYCDLFFVLGTSITFNYYKLIPLYYTILLIFKFSEFNITSMYMRNHKKDKVFVFDKIGRIVCAGYFLVPFFVMVNFLIDFKLIYIIALTIGTLMSSASRIGFVIKDRVIMYSVDKR